MKRMACLLCLALGAQAARASDAAMGFQITLCRPQSDLNTLMDGKTGFGFGLHSFNDIGEGGALVSRFDMRSFHHSAGELEARVDEAAAGVDYDYFILSRVGTGFYASVGMGIAWSKADLRAAGYQQNQTKGTYYWALGMGWMATERVGVEIKYHGAHYAFDAFTPSGISPVFADQSLSASSIDLTCMVRF